MLLFRPLYHERSSLAFLVVFVGSRTVGASTGEVTKLSFREGLEGDLYIVSFWREIKTRGIYVRELIDIVLNQSLLSETLCKE